MMSGSLENDKSILGEKIVKIMQESDNYDDVTSASSEADPSSEPLEADPPFDYTSMLALCTGMLAHSVVFTAPLPFVAFMVMDFDMAPNLDTAGYSAGWITGAFMIGRTVSGLPWGMASDKWGRRPCLLMSMFFVALFGLLLGFSTNFATAVVLRLAIGLGNGFMGIAKTCISEIFPRCHELKAFGMLNGVWGLGLIVGPAIGGLLSRPAVQYPHYVSQQSIWGRFPYLLPCLFCSLLAVIAFVCLYVWLPETAGKAYRASRDADKLEAEKNQTEVEMQQLPPDAVTAAVASAVSVTEGERVMGDSGVSAFVIEAVDDEGGEGEECKDGDDPLFSGEEHPPLTLAPHMPSHSQPTTDDDDNEQQPVDTAGAGYKQRRGRGWLAGVWRSFVYDAAPSADADTEFSKLPSDSAHRAPLVLSSPPATVTAAAAATTAMMVSGRSRSSRPTTVGEMLCDPQLCLLSGVYTCYCFAVMFVDETFPLWAVSSVAKGGLGWSSARVGSALACMGLGMVVFQMCLYERFIKSCCGRGAASTYLRLTCVSAVAVAALNECAHAAYRHHGDGACLYVVVVGVLFVYCASATSAFTTLGVVINASVDRDTLGTYHCQLPLIHLPLSTVTHSHTLTHHPLVHLPLSHPLRHSQRPHHHLRLTGQRPGSDLRIHLVRVLRGLARAAGRASGVLRGGCHHLHPGVCHWPVPGG